MLKDLLTKWVSGLLPGYKTLLGAFGLIGTGLVLISQGDWVSGLNSVALGLAALGIRFSKE